MSLASINNVIHTDLQAIDSFILGELHSAIPLINDMVDYVLSCGGKRIRPMILLLSAHALAYETHPVEPAFTKKSHIALASVIELIHTATLLHDDVVDQSTLRRRHKTANAIWGNDASVLIGDFLYSRAFKIVVEAQNSAILTIFSDATHFIAEGEILQLTNCNNANTSEKFYFDIIERKTAKLFEVSAHIGALLATSDSEKAYAFAQFGHYLGLAYQLVDDALDYNSSSESSGKNVGQDINEGKMTLPLIYAMQHCDVKDAALIRTAITTGTCESLTPILEIIEVTAAIQYTLKVAQLQIEKAKSALARIVDSPYKQALISLADFIIQRSY